MMEKELTKEQEALQKFVSIENRIHFKSKNGVKLIGINGVEKNYTGDSQKIWRIYTNEFKYIDSVDNMIGKMYSLSWGNVDSFTDFVSIWRGRYVLNRITIGMDKNPLSYGLELYEISQKEFADIIADMKILMDEGCNVQYNDENGVGHFSKKGNSYLATHHRYGNTKKKKITLDKIAKFLREFFDLGYSYKQIDNWK